MDTQVVYDKADVLRRTLTTQAYNAHGVLLECANAINAMDSDLVSTAFDPTFWKVMEILESYEDLFVQINKDHAAFMNEDVAQ